MTDKINNFFNSWNFTTVNRIKFLFTFIMTIIGLLISFNYGLAFGGCITAAFVCYNIYKKIKTGEFDSAEVVYVALGWMIGILCYVPVDAFC